MVCVLNAQTLLVCISLEFCQIIWLQILLYNFNENIEKKNKKIPENGKIQDCW